MSGTKLTPEKITSPIQLMAAWFSMLVLLVGVLLTAAVKIEKPDWAAGFLVIFTFAVVVAVFTCVTLMLTKYRPHLQDGKEYARWLKDKNEYSEGLQIKAPKHTTKQRPTEPETIKPSSADKTKYLVSLLATVGADTLEKCLSRAGFNVEIYDDPFKDQKTYALDRQESIWIGSRVPPAVASEAINIAISKWPQLKYLHLSDDGEDTPPDFVHDQIFIGGSSSTAEEIGLLKWTKGELRSLTNAKTIEDFHKLIREHYIS